MSIVAGVYFYLHGKQFAFRAWNFVPRIGETVILGSDDDRKAYQVKNVVWGNEPENFRARGPEAQNVHIYIEPAKD